VGQGCIALSLMRKGQRVGENTSMAQFFPYVLEQKDDGDLWKDNLFPPNASGQSIKPRCMKSPNYFNL